MGSTATTKTPRARRTERIGSELMDAALQVFLEQGFHGASLDKIAAAAGYTKGVVYTRFASKADLFLALLEARIADRAEENAAMAAGQHGAGGLTELARRWDARQREDEAWTLLVLEFRVHAARSPELTERYAALHDGTLTALSRTIASVLDDGGSPERDRRLARVLLTLGNGATLEQAVDATAYGADEVEALTRAVVEGLR